MPVLVRVSDPDEQTFWAQPPSAVRPGKAWRWRTLRYTGTCSTSGTKQDFAWRRGRPECACPEGKSLPLS